MLSFAAGILVPKTACAGINLGIIKAVENADEKLTEKMKQEGYNTGTSSLLYSPSQLTVSALSPTINRLSWQDNSVNEFGFVLERRCGTGTWGEIATVGKNIIQYDDTVSQGIVYYYRVSAYGAYGHSEPSDEAAKQCTLTIISAYGTTEPPAGSYLSGTVLTASVTSPIEKDGIRYACTGWTGTGSVPANGTGTSAVFTITQNSSITWNWQASACYLTTSVNPANSGSVSLSGWYESGTVITVNAAPAQGWTFSNWSDDLSGSNNPATITMNGPKSVTANFVREYTLTVASAYGTLTPAVGTHLYPSEAPITASVSSPVENAGIRYVCTGWTGTGSVPASGTGTSVAFTITRNSNITWLWKTEYYLTTSVNPIEGGSITPSSGWYGSGTVVAVTATPAQGWTFTTWSGDLSGINTTGTITMNGPKSVTATVAPVINTLTVISAYGSPAPPVGTHSYSSGTIIVATVTSTIENAGIRYVCTGWTGTGSVPASGTGTTVAFTITRNSNITWNWETQYYLTTSVNPPEGGTVTPSGWYKSSTVATVTITPAQGWTFTAWSGDLSGINTTGTITMNGTKSVTATVAPLYSLMVTSVQGSPIPTAGTHYYSSGATITASVTSPVENAGIRYICTGWTGTGDVPASGTGTTVSFIVTQNSSIIWNWQEAAFYLTTIVNPANAGSITPVSGWYENGSIATLTATANSGYVFSYWGGSLSGTDTTGIITMNGSKSVTANFSRTTYTIIASAGSHGSITPSGTVTIPQGASQTFTITPDSGCQIATVTVDGVSIGATTTYTFGTVTSDHTISATFAVVSGGPTNVSGIISTDTTWTLARSPYIVTGNIMVNNGVTLRIEPGVTVKIGAGRSFLIEGTLTARGTADSKISFTRSSIDEWGYIFFSGSSTDAVYDGSGNYMSGSIIEHAVIEYGGSLSVNDNAALRIQNASPCINYCTIANSKATGIRIWDISQTLRITNSTIKDNKGSGISVTTSNGGNVIVSTCTVSGNTAGGEGGGIYAFNYSSITITNCTVSGNTAGGEGGGICAFNYSSITITNCTVSGNTAGDEGGGIYAFNSSSSITITNCTVSGNTASGNGGGIYADNNYYSSITITNCTVSGNTASGNGGGIYADSYYYSSITITNCTVSKNKALNASAVFFATGGDNDFKYNTITENQSTQDNGCTVYLGSYPIFSYNSIYNNTATYEIWNSHSHGSADVDVKNNWWGTAVESEIEAKIYDWIDDATKSVVNYFPYLTQPYTPEFTFTINSIHGTPIPSTGTHSYPLGKTITASVVSPVEDAGIRYICTGWTGTGDVPASGTGTTVSFTVTQNSSIIWNWQETAFYLTTTVNPANAGSVTPSGWYESGTVAIVTATPAQDWTFTTWTGDISGTNTTGTITMNGAKSVTANFMTNIIPLALPGMSHATTFYGNDSKTYYGSEAIIYDNDFSTYIGLRNVAAGAGHESNASYVDNYQTWTTPITIYSLRAKMYSEYLSYGNYDNRSVTPLVEQYIWVRISDSWILVWSYVRNNPGGAAVADGSQLTDQTVNGHWDNVTGVRTYAGSKSYSYEGSRTSYTYNYIYEVQAFGVQ